MEYPSWLVEEGRRLADARKSERARAMRLILEGRIPAVERDRSRLARVIDRQVGAGLEVAAALSAGVPLETLSLDPEQAASARIALGLDTYLSLDFLERASRVANAVGLLIDEADEGAGTCFMISPRLLATAGHALENREMAEDRRVEFTPLVDGEMLSPSLFKLAPDKLFLSRKNMGFDCSIVALGDRLDDSEFQPEHCPLSNKGNKHALGYFANLIHHPSSEPKLLGVRENRIIDRLDDPTLPDEFRRDWVLVYRTQTESGSSGAPVFNDAWQVVAVHSWGEERDQLDLGCGVKVSDQVNHGVRASFIYERLRELTGLTPEEQELVDEAAPPT